MCVASERGHELLRLIVAEVAADAPCADGEVPRRNETVAAGVQCHERTPQISALGLRQLPRKQLQRGPAQLAVRPVPPQAPEDRCVEGAGVDVAVRCGLGRVLEPQVRQCSVRPEPPLWVRLEAPLAEVARVLRSRLEHLRGKPRGRGHLHRTEAASVVGGTALKGRPSSEQLAEYDPDAEHVRLLVVVTTLDHLRRHVVRRPRALHHFLLNLAPPRRG
mmetsp:Transcript_9664/g.25278  ORF Transcript_9664/g.25278 Transcript_9664/m.25278 type:complete len:219 (-) Transcript_9664:776-1432(-)